MAIAPSISGDTVTVVCRLPSGMVMEIHDLDGLKDRRSTGQIDMSVPQPVKRIPLRGVRRDPRFHAKDNRMIGLGGRTEVAKSDWEAWIKQNAKSALVTRNVVFAVAKESDAKAKLSDVAQDLTGFEPNDPENLRGRSKKFETDDDK